MSRTWVLLRGLGREKAHWRGFDESLQLKFQADKVLTLDLPGAGDLNQLTSPLTVEEITRQVRAQLISKKIEEEVILFANSLGGMVALEWIKQKPEQIRAAVLVNSSLNNLNPFYERLRWQVFANFFGKVMLKKGEDREREVLKLISNRRDLHTEVAREWAEIAKIRPMNPKNTLRQLFAASRYKFTDEKVDPEVLILQGMGDQLVSPACSEALHKYFQWDIERHPWGGHDLTLDDPEWVLEKLKNWLR